MGGPNTSVEFGPGVELLRDSTVTDIIMWEKLVAALLVSYVIKRMYPSHSLIIYSACES